MLTTDEVLVEFLAFFSGMGEILRKKAASFARAAMKNPNVSVLPQTRDSFLTGLALYEQRLDKGYSLVDCISMQTMRRKAIKEVLTTDHHFEQEGFTILLKE